MRALLPPLACAALLCAQPAAADDGPAFGDPLPDAALAEQTGKFILPNGASLALTVTSDTVVDGVAVLRTVFALDQAAQVRVFGRDGGAVVRAPRADAGQSAGPTGVSVLFDRQSGTQVISPTFSVGAATAAVGKAADAASLGLAPLVIVAGGPAVRTPDGLVTLDPTANGAQVTLAGDRLGVAHLVGASVATAIANSANDRTIDTVTNIDIDLRDVTPFVQASAAMRVGDLALDATRGMVR